MLEPTVRSRVDSSIRQLRVGSPTHRPAPRRRGGETRTAGVRCSRRTWCNTAARLCARRSCSTRSGATASSASRRSPRGSSRFARPSATTATGRRSSGPCTARATSSSPPFEAVAGAATVGTRRDADDRRPGEPRVQPLIGRESLMPLLVDALATHRLITLVGPGASGKTSLGFELARDGRRQLRRRRARGRAGERRRRRRHVGRVRDRDRRERAPQQLDRRRHRRDAAAAPLPAAARQLRASRRIGRRAGEPHPAARRRTCRSSRRAGSRWRWPASRCGRSSRCRRPRPALSSRGGARRSRRSRCSSSARRPPTPTSCSTTPPRRLSSRSAGGSTASRSRSSSRRRGRAPSTWPRSRAASTSGSACSRRCAAGATRGTARSHDADQLVVRPAPAGRTGAVHGAVGVRGLVRSRLRRGTRAGRRRARPADAPHRTFDARRCGRRPSGATRYELLETLRDYGRAASRRRPCGRAVHRARLALRGGGRRRSRPSCAVRTKRPRCARADVVVRRSAVRAAVRGRGRRRSTTPSG